MTSPEHNPTDPLCQCSDCIRGWMSDNFIESMPLPDAANVLLFAACGIDTSDADFDPESWLGEALDHAPIAALWAAWRITLSQGEEAAP